MEDFDSSTLSREELLEISREDYSRQQEAFREAGERWRTNVKEHLLPVVRRVDHLAQCLSGCLEKVVEANTLFGGAMTQRSREVLLEIAEALNLELELLGRTPGYPNLYYDHDTREVLLQLIVASGRFRPRRDLKTVTASELAALDLASERFQSVLKDLEETAAYEGNFDGPTIGLMVSTKSIDTASPGKRPCYARDHKFLEWYETKETSTYHSHAGIVDKWTALNKEHRDAIAGDCIADVTRPSVIKAVKKAQLEQDGKKK